MMIAIVQIVVFQTFAVPGPLNCPSGQYLFDGVCERCPDNCSICHSASICSKCKVGYYGETCSMVCNANCRDNACDKSEGVCLNCADGYFKDTNKNCIVCPSNCVICFSDTQCTLCKNGFKSPRCQEVCTDCKPGTACDQTTGICYECKQGFTGNACDEKCDSKCSVCQRVKKDICVACANEKYGKICENECPTHCVNKTCNDSDGFCTHGCQDGYLGPFCNETTKHEDDRQGWITVVSICVPVAVIIFVVIILIKRRSLVNRNGLALEEGTGSAKKIIEPASHDVPSRSRDIQAKNRKEQNFSLVKSFSHWFKDAQKRN